MFIVLIVANLFIAAAITLLAVVLLRRPLDAMIQKRFGDEDCRIWSRYILFFISAMSLAVGTRIWDIERYVAANTVTTISADQLALELFRTAIATISSNALFTFIVLIAVWVVMVTRRKE